MCLLLLAGLGAHAQGFGTVTGQVLCSDTSKPARFAQVGLVPDASGGGTTGGAQDRRSSGSNNSITGPDGTFTIKNVAAGVYDVQVTLPGYIQPLRQINLLANSGDPTTQQPWLDMLTKVTVPAGQTVSAIATAYRGADLTGTVLYDDGSPASGVNVSALIAMAANGTPASTTSSTTTATATIASYGVSAQTDDRGHFRLSGLADGSYTVMAAPRGGSVFPIYLGNTIDRTQALFLPLKTGEERSDLAVQVDITNLHRVRGVVVTPNGHALPNVGVMLTLAGSAGGMSSLRETSGPDGSFSFVNVPDGKFTVATAGARDPDTQAIYKGANTQITVSGTDISDVVLTPSL